MSKISRAVYLALGAAVVASPALAQDQQLQNPPDGGAAVVVLEAETVLPEMDISLDGRVDEASWGRAVPITDFTQQEPVEGGVPSQRTEVRVLFDEENIYISAILYDDPEGILAYQMQRDAPLMTDDRFMWILDTFNDGRTGYFFEINANGLMGDGLITGSGGGGRGGRGGGGGFGGGGMNKAWDGIWEARTFRRPDGWSAEIQIPFRTLNFDPDADHWGINFQRTIRRNNEEILWRGWRRTEGLNKPIFAGDLVGISTQGIQRGYGLELRGSGIGAWRNVPTAAEPRDFHQDISLDIDYNITPSLRASASINTDFAEVESDERRVNLTRFPQRFRERRAFFLEGSGVFSFAPRSNPQPFFSRRIGLNAGQEIPIEYGTRMTGQAGSYEIGFYQIGTGNHEYTDTQGILQDFTREQFSVARVKRRIFEQSTIGAIYTRRATSAASPLQGESGVAPGDRHTAGMDLAFNTRNFLGNKNLELEAFYVWNSNPDPTVVRTTTDLSAHGFRLNLPNDIWSGHVSYRQFGDDYSPAVGFVPRNDFRRVEPRIGWSPRPSSIDWIRSLDFSVQFRHLEELGSGIVEEREWDLNLLGVRFESGDGFSVNAKRVYEFLDFGYEIVDGVDILPGDYTNWEYSIRGNTAGRRRVSLYGSVTTGGFWDGDRTRYGGRVSFRPNPGINISTNIEYNDAQLPTGDFTTSLYELETEWNPSPWMSLTNQLQYDSRSEIIGLFARLRWIIEPGNDVYLVYTHNWRDCSLYGAGSGCSGLDFDPRADPRFMTLSRGGALKLNYTFRL
ncbi:MAG: DUF5916 domain-containing protein [Gammaproteobacteria bacterium]|nr:DUF5916 domain-containing protein [Gammaproteobacteria bacterium]MDE0258259.1 DUF5916 domain-containing protein [Gammaproteobacteria bacterium]